MFMDVERAQAILEREEIDVLVSNRPANVTYVSGFHENLECRFVPDLYTYALIFRSQPPSMVMPWFEVPSVRSKSDVEAIISDLVWIEAPTLENPVGLLQGSAEGTVAKVIGQHHLSTGRIGIDQNAMALTAFEQLQEHVPGATFVPATHVFQEIRSIKTPVEVLRIEEAVQAVECGYQALEANLREGVTERELTLKARDVVLAAGADDIIFNFVTSEPRNGIDHVVGADFEIKAGEIIKCDIGAHYDGYCSDIGRSFSCGEPSREKARIYQRILETQERVLAAAKPGVIASDLFRIYLEGMREGYGETPWHMIGHGVGVEVHEVPLIGPLNHRPLQSGMVLAVEIGYLDPGRLGYQLEDMILITEDGNRSLSSLHKNLPV